MKKNAIEFDEACGNAISLIGTADFCDALSSLIASLVDFDNLVILAFPPKRAPILLHFEGENKDVLDALHGAYLGGAYLLDPFYQLHLNAVLPDIYDLHEIAPDQFKRSSYYVSHYRYTNMIDEVAVVVHSLDGYTVTVCVGKDSTSGQAFSSHEKKAFQDRQCTIVAIVGKHWRNVSPALEGKEVAGRLDHKTITNIAERALKVKLTNRQSQVALLILQGNSSEAIGLKLEISRQTVKVFRSQLYKRCDISSQAELFSLFFPFISDPHWATKFDPLRS